MWSVRDVTAQRRAARALRASEAHLRDLAIRDGLTGLFNRRHALEQLITAVSQGERLAVALLDVDHFKHVNDGHGHLVGDAVLRDLARVLSDRLRTGDVVGRYGGEEFMVLLPRATAHQAAVVLDGIRARLSDRPGTDALPRYTFSCGVAEFPDDGATVNELLARADQRLYQAKRAGRDRVVGRDTG
ncbi:MAG: GGDEF domain-containing protein [Kofleriaceae bacterium]